MDSKLLLLLALVAVAAAAAEAEAKAKGEGGICGVSISEMMGCQPAVATGAAEPPKPTEACCASVKHANLTCFCTFKNNRSLPLFGINATRAMELPTKCDPAQTMNCT